MLRVYRDLCTSAPDQLALVYGLIPGPAGELVALPVGWFGPVDDGPAQVAAVLELAPVFADFGPMPYTALQSMFDASAPAGVPRYWKSGMLSELDDAVIATIVQHGSGRPTPISPVLLFHLHGAAVRHPVDTTAFSARRHAWDIEILAQWADPADETGCLAWARAFWEAIQPHLRGLRQPPGA